VLFPLFEAVMNSIHAIEERFGRDQISKGYISITILRNDNGDYLEFQIQDNGIGFNQQNLDSFMKMDSQKKVSIGGKGVGRLLWLKVCKSVKIQSVFSNKDSNKEVSFNFCLENPISELQYSDCGSDAKIGTTVRLHPYKDVYVTHIPRKTITIANRILAHFISYFVNISHPVIKIIDDKENIDLFEQFTNVTERDKDFKFTLDIAGREYEFVFHCFLLPKAISDDEKSTNALYLGANGRAVKRYELDPVLGLKAVQGKYAFLGYIESEILDTTANDTRTEFSLSSDDLDSIINSAKENAKEFLSNEIREIRERQKKIIADLRSEYPRFLTIAKDPGGFSGNLHLSTQTEEDIFLELSRQSLRHYKKIKKSFLTSVKNKSSEIIDKAREYVDGLQDESLSSLAEYVMKRKLILEVFEESLKYTDIPSGKSEYEKVIHEIICPLKSTSEKLDYDNHNLWIIDDHLAFFTYFNSDKPMSSQVRNAPNPRDRPDISIFDLGLGFQNSDISQPITVIEFKRPKRDDYDLKNNPITQVRKYVSDMRESGTILNFDGTPLRRVDEKTPFVCHIIADVTQSLKSVMKDLGSFHQKVGSGTWYRWDDSYNIFIEISSFKDVLDSARLRNHAFFKRIGLDN